jgi:hypothetical protein
VDVYLLSSISVSLLQKIKNKKKESKVKREKRRTCTEREALLPIASRTQKREAGRLSTLSKACTLSPKKE